MCFSLQTLPLGVAEETMADRFLNAELPIGAAGDTVIDVFQCVSHCRHFPCVFQETQ